MHNYDPTRAGCLSPEEVSAMNSVEILERLEELVFPGSAHTICVEEPPDPTGPTDPVDPVTPFPYGGYPLHSENITGLGNLSNEHVA